jgi:hypothetical protein
MINGLLYQTREVMITGDYVLGAGLNKIGAVTGFAGL